MRFQYPGAIYHVMARGDGGKAILETDDRLVFLKRLRETCASCGWRVHARVLVPIISTFYSRPRSQIRSPA
ncbi:MAG: hypothetical protein ACO3JG_07600 [Luteolibacter sp.]